MNPLANNLFNFSRLRQNFISIGFWTLLGRLLGILKDTLLVNFFGISSQADAFFLAYRIPNLFRATFAEGSIPGATVPLFSELLFAGKQLRARRLLTLILLVFGMFGLGIVLLFWHYPLPLLKVLAWGLDNSKAIICSQFLRWLIVLLPIFSLASIFASFLQATGFFTVQAAGPALFNLVSIGVLIIAIAWGQTPVFVCLGILLAGLIKLLSRWWLLQQMSFGPMLPDAQSLQDLKVAGKRFLPLMGGIFFSTANAGLETLTASFLPTGQIVLMHYIFRQFNIVLYSISSPLEQALLPELSRINDQPTKLSFYLQENLKLTLFLTLPTSLFIWCCAPQICWLLLGHKTNLAQLTLASQSLQVLALAVGLNVIQRNLSRFFYAVHDTTTPTLVWGSSIIITGIINLLAVTWWKAQILAILIITAISWALIVVIKLWLLARSQIIINFKELFQFARYLLFCCLPSVVAIFGLLRGFEAMGLHTFGFWWHRLFLLALLVISWTLFLKLFNWLRNRFLKNPAHSCKFIDE